MSIQTSPPGGGPPPHRHSKEDEYFSVLEGRFELLIEGESKFDVKRRDRFAPRNHWHTFRNVGESDGQNSDHRASCGSGKVLSKQSAHWSCPATCQADGDIRISTALNYASGLIRFPGRTSVRNHRRRSRRLWPVGPVTTLSPSAVKSGQASNSASEAAGSNQTTAPCSPLWYPRSRLPPGCFRPKRIGTGAECHQVLSLVLCQVDGAGQRELLVASPGPCGALQPDCDLAAGNKAKSWMFLAQSVEAAKQVIRRFGRISPNRRRSRQ